MIIRIEEVEKIDKKRIDALMQLYLHDISLYFPMDFDKNTCTYSYDELDDYIKGEIKKSYFIYHEDELIGFTLVDIADEENVIQEMFILNNYKAHGYGYEAAKVIFDTFRGNWVVKALPASEKAENFWTKTINKYTNGSFDLEHVGKYNRAVFRFNNK